MNTYHVYQYWVTADGRTVWTIVAEVEAASAEEALDLARADGIERPVVQPAAKGVMQ